MRIVVFVLSCLGSARHNAKELKFKYSHEPGSQLLKALAPLLLAFQCRDVACPAAHPRVRKLSMSSMNTMKRRPRVHYDAHVVTRRMFDMNLVDDHYSEDWLKLYQTKKFIGNAPFLAISCNGDITPKQNRHRSHAAIVLDFIGEQFGRAIRKRLETLDYSIPEQRIRRIVCIEKPYLRGFVTGFNSAAVSGHDSSHPGTAGNAHALKSESDRTAPSEKQPDLFVLLLVNGGDYPASPEYCECLKELPTMAACFTTNLCKLPSSISDTVNIHPLPLGVTDTRATRSMKEEFVIAARKEALPWSNRSKKLLVTPSAKNNRLRPAYTNLFTQVAGYEDLVHVVTEKMSPAEFIRMLSRYRAVLSPPGRGHDCFRTWQALSVGSVPLVVKDDVFDQRLYEGTGAAYIPRPECLTPQILRELLDGLEDPAEVHGEQSQMEFWKRKWESCLLPH